MPEHEWPLVRRGDVDSVGDLGHSGSNSVHTVQHLLRQHGIGVTVDGIFGPKTEAAVRGFQQSKGLAADGIVGPRTWPELMVVVKRGSQGEAVRAVQSFFDFLARDGIFGPRTEAAVRELQGNMSLVVDGIVGPETWTTLLFIASEV
ncbi:MAG: peptidoglycan-binding protein [Actinobacteria bacterium]|nr:peptidoglycan-binding protein [Actinomycetota bacterium]